MYQNFTSLPPEQERTFVVYEQAAVESSKKARTLGIISGVAVGLLGLLLYMAFPAGENPHAVKEEPKELAEEKAAPAPEPAAEVPAATAEEPAAEGEEAEEAEVAE